MEERQPMEIQECLTKIYPVCALPSPLSKDLLKNFALREIRFVSKLKQIFLRTVFIKIRDTDSLRKILLLTVYNPAWLHGFIIAWFYKCMLARFHNCMVLQIHGLMDSIASWLHGFKIACLSSAEHYCKPLPHYAIRHYCPWIWKLQWTCYSQPPSSLNIIISYCFHPTYIKKCLI